MVDVPLIDCKNVFCKRVARANELFCCWDCRTGNGLKRHTASCTQADKARAQAMEAAIGYKKLSKPPKTSKIEGVVDAYRSPQE